MNVKGLAFFGLLMNTMGAIYSFMLDWTALAVVNIVCILWHIYALTRRD